MRSEVIYEWTIETVDSYGDIIDNDFTEKLSTVNKEDFAANKIALVRNEGNEMEGLTDRYWAYVAEGKLPEYFSASTGAMIGIKVPKKYHQELSAYLKTI